jgi:hypothetical protein
MIGMILGVLTNHLDYMQEPTDMTPDLLQVAQSPALQQMLKYTSVGSMEKVKQKTEDLQKTGVNEIMVASHIYHQEDWVNSYRIFSEIMNGIGSKF